MHSRSPGILSHKKCNSQRFKARELDINVKFLHIIITSGLTNKCDLKIADFGLATVTDPSKQETLRCGSPGYVAPEVLNNLGYGTKADIFSAGIILMVM